MAVFAYISATFLTTFFLLPVLLVVALVVGTSKGILFEAVSGWVIILTLIGTIVGIVKLKGWGNDVPVGATLLVFSLAALAATIFFLARHLIQKGRGQDGR